MHPAAQGSLIGGGVGFALALVRRPKPGQADNRVARVVKSAAEGAAAGALVGLVLDRRLRSQATALLAANAPLVLDAVSDYVRRYEPAVDAAAGRVRDIAADAYGAARPRVEDAYGVVRSRLAS
jgi:hypothetical protein